MSLDLTVIKLVLKLLKSNILHTKKLNLIPLRFKHKHDPDHRHGVFKSRGYMILSKSLIRYIFVV
jgi:hypothetical protein